MNDGKEPVVQPTKRIVPSPCGNWEIHWWPGGRKELRISSQGRRNRADGVPIPDQEEALKAIARTRESDRAPDNHV